ncbi:hypothetical protein [Pseudonocardia asaccharolytica]|uniref:Uncharacterized protein n=1 Tax=Pseudonocardia asaccharolytica DSM 44247 = NBRC 16224 TaxID=1123024 RepID=A0A511D102_9PSEU|nr:hypothetical protein [Pseudonocardia asaccharolytica]GEL16558.1 hypothetical protein PA7_03950 [Pseudonocardia asaccharolytica DSM 44247 = NBRC 16224]
MSPRPLLPDAARPARVAGLAGLLCGPGQIVRFGAGDMARLSIVLPDPSSAAAVVAACAEAGVIVEVTTTESGATAVRTAFRRDLTALAAAWTRGVTKAVPAGMRLDGPLLRLWALAAGRPDDCGGYLLALDPHAPGTHRPLVAAATGAGLGPVLLARRPGLRISGARRLRRLAELIGPAPPELPAGHWPRGRIGS